MSFIRTAKRENPFVQMDKYFLEDENLSFEAKGLLAYVLSKPDTWTIRRTDLIKRSKSGRNRIESALLELMAAGYMNWYQERTEEGTFGDWIYNVYERPEFNPDAETCIKEGLDRIHHRKTVNKQKNKAKLSPKADNLHTDSPKAGYPQADNPNTDNLPSSNNDFSDIELSNIDLNKEEEEAASFLVDLFEKNIKKTNASIENDLAAWVKILPVDVIANEIKYAAKRNATSFSYLEASLKQNKDMGIDTVEKLEKKRADYAASKKKPVSGKKRHVREEVLPEWFADRQKANNAPKEPTEGENEALKKEQAEFLEKMRVKREAMKKAEGAY